MRKFTKEEWDKMAFEDAFTSINLEGEKITLEEAKKVWKENHSL